MGKSSAQRQREREAERQRGREAERQRGREAERQSDREAERQREGEPERGRDREEARKRGKEAKRQRGRERPGVEWEKERGEQTGEHRMHVLFLWRAWVAHDPAGRTVLTTALTPCRDHMPRRCASIATVIAGCKSPFEVSRSVEQMSLPIPPELWSDLKAEGLLPQDIPVPSSQ